MRCIFAWLFFLATFSLALAEGKTVRDWTANCDQSQTCIAETTAGGYRLQVGRYAGGNTAWFIAFIMKDVPKPKAQSDMTVSIDGAQPFALSQDYGYLADADGETFGVGNTLDLDELFAAFRKGKTLDLAFESEDGKKHKQTFSLSGSVASMLWIDDEQKRVGNSSEIESPTGVRGEAKFTAAKEIADKVAKMSSGSDCSDTGEERKLESYHLPGGKALHLLPCFFGPYNFTHLVFVERQGEITQQFFADYAEDYGWTGTEQLFNIEYDPGTGWLRSFYKGRGIGDCGSAGEWVWHNDLFRLMSFSAWDDCENGRDSEKWPVVFAFKPQKMGQ